MAAVSFQIKGVNGGFTEVNGLLSLGKDRLLMEFEKADAIVGFFRSGATSVGIEFTCIRDLVYKKGFLSAGKNYPQDEVHCRPEPGTRLEIGFGYFNCQASRSR